LSDNTVNYKKTIFGKKSFRYLNPLPNMITINVMGGGFCIWHNR